MSAAEKGSKPFTKAPRFNSPCQEMTNDVVRGIVLSYYFWRFVDVTLRACTLDCTAIMKLSLLVAISSDKRHRIVDKHLLMSVVVFLLTASMNVDG